MIMIIILFQLLSSAEWLNQQSGMQTMQLKQSYKTLQIHHQDIKRLKMQWIAWTQISYNYLCCSHPLK
jgi:hypothetical protein